MAISFFFLLEAAAGHLDDYDDNKSEGKTKAFGEEGETESKKR